MDQDVRGFPSFWHHDAEFREGGGVADDLLVGRVTEKKDFRSAHETRCELLHDGANQCVLPARRKLDDRTVRKKDGLTGKVTVAGFML